MLLAFDGVTLLAVLGARCWLNKQKHQESRVTQHENERARAKKESETSRKGHVYHFLIFLLLQFPEGGGGWLPSFLRRIPLFSLEASCEPLSSLETSNVDCSTSSSSCCSFSDCLCRRAHSRICSAASLSMTACWAFFKGEHVAGRKYTKGTGYGW